MIVFIVLELPESDLVSDPLLISKMFEFVIQSIR